MRLKINRNGPRFKLRNDWQRKPKLFSFSGGTTGFVFFLLLLFFCAIYVFILLFFSEPVFHDIRSSLPFKLIIRLAFLALVLWLAWFVKPLPTTLSRFLLTLMALLPFGELILPTDRIIVFFHILLFFCYIASFMITFTDFLFDYRPHFTSYLAALYLAARLMYSAKNRFTPVNDRLITFAVIFSVVIAAAAAIVFIFRCSRPVNSVRVDRALTAFLILVVWFVSFIFVKAAAINANYALDFSEPQYSVTVIDSKCLSHAPKSPAYYSFVVQTDGNELWLNVSAAQFELYETGDTITIVRYDGAFGIPYYMLDE